MPLVTLLIVSLQLISIFVVMSAIQPQGEKLRKAVRWLSERRRYTADAIGEAARRFDLSPADEEFLLQHFLHADHAPADD